MKMNQFRPEITRVKVWTFEMSGKITDSANVASEPAISTPSHTSAASFSRYLAALVAEAECSKNYFLVLLG